MRTRRDFLVVAALFAAFTFIPHVYAQMLVNMETVTVGDSGNAADTRVMMLDGTSGYGAVDYEFRIGKYEVTIGQYTAFLNSVASVTSDSHLVNLWNPSMASDQMVAGISRGGTGSLLDPYIYSAMGPYGITPPGATSATERPIGFINWHAAARFANWMHNGAANGASTESGAYTLNGATNGRIMKNANANWWIPSENEWYKAAYYKGGGTNAGYWLYPTQSDTAPDNQIGSQTNQANYFTQEGYKYSVIQSPLVDLQQNYLTDVGAFTLSPSAYGTFDQGGNLYELSESATDPSLVVLRGGGFGSYGPFGLPAYSRDIVGPEYVAVFSGFRLATVPEPSTYALLLMTGAGALWLARRRR